jgi:Bacterial tandem repeat domain 1
MSMSRRLALGCVSAFAVTGGTVELGVASVLKSTSTAPLLSNVSNTQTSQRFLELLIHQDESGRHMPYVATIAIVAPDTQWLDHFSLEDYKYRILDHNSKKHGYRLRRVSSFKTRDGIRYSALWELATGPDWDSAHATKSDEFEKVRNDYKQRGFRMTYIDARVNYAGIWERGDPTTQQVFHDLTLVEYEQQFATLTAQGFRPVRISTSAQGSVPLFSAIFEKASNAVWQANHQMTATQFAKLNAEAKSKGYQLMDASGIMVSGHPSFSGIWQKIAANQTPTRAGTAN